MNMIGALIDHAWYYKQTFYSGMKLLEVRKCVFSTVMKRWQASKLVAVRWGGQASSLDHSSTLKHMDH